MGFLGLLCSHLAGLVFFFFLTILHLQRGSEKPPFGGLRSPNTSPYTSISAKIRTPYPRREHAKGRVKAKGYEARGEMGLGLSHLDGISWGNVNFTGISRRF